MELNHKSEWGALIDISRRKSLDYDKIILLLAIREVENGPTGHEFNRLEATGEGLEYQARAMANFLLEKEFAYQKYLKTTHGNIFDFIEYISDSDDKSNRIKEALELVNKEFDSKKEKI